MTDASPGVRAGVVGLGMMGGGIARSLRRAGVLGAACDLDPARVADLTGEDVVACASCTELATRVDIVVVVVFDAAQVDAVLFGTGGIAEAAKDGLDVLVRSTIGPGDVARLAAGAAARGITLLDVGIAGGPELAARGELVTLVGGDEAAVAASLRCSRPCPARSSMPGRSARACSSSW